MKRKTKLILLLTLLFVIINSVAYIITEINKEQRIQVALDSHLKNLETHYEILLHHQDVTADAAYKSTTNIKEVIEILSKVKDADKKKRDILRERLSKLLSKKYKILKTKGVLQYHFVLPDNRVFLRMHKPSKFGDDLSDIRYSFAYTNRTHKPISGFEQGRTTHAFRHIYPIFDENKNYLASIDIAFSSEFLQDYFVSFSKIHTHLLISKHIFDVKAWKRDDMMFKYAQSGEHKDYMMSIMHSDYKEKHIIENTNRIMLVKAQIKEKMDENKRFSLYIIDHKKSIVLSFYPIKNIKDKKVMAWIVAYEEDPFIQMTIKMNFYFQFITFLILSILFYFIYKVMNQKEILDIQVKEKTYDLNITNKELEESERKLYLLNETLEVRVEKEVAKNKEKEQMLFQQSKMASMGEMIGNIAHQWRQPIAIISMWANNIIVDIDMEEIESDNLRKYANNINEQTNHLSKTIDDFRNFFTPNKEKNSFTLKSSIDRTMSLLTASFKTHSIEVIESIEDIEITTLENELTQAILNIIKNAKDILITLPKDTKRLLFITIYKKDNRALIEIKDNGGGVPQEIINKVFEPYFTTKHKSQGTGIGLYMTESIITKHLNGSIKVENSKYKYDGISCVGAKFTVNIPIG